MEHTSAILLILAIRIKLKCSKVLYLCYLNEDMFLFRLRLSQRPLVCKCIQGMRYKNLYKNQDIDTYMYKKKLLGVSLFCQENSEVHSKSSYSFKCLRILFGTLFR